MRVPGKTLCAGLSAAFEPGQCWAVLGQNGSGKTTLLHTLCGLRAAQAGGVALDARPLTALRRDEIAIKIGLLLQEEVPAFWGSVLEYAMLGRFPHDAWSSSRREAADLAAAALAQMGLGERAGQALATLSGGERQRARIAQLLVQDPQVYCLDEPLLHLDLKHQLQVLQLFRRLADVEKKCVIMVLHDGLWASRFCDRVLMLYDGGRVQAGETARLLTLQNLQTLYDCEAEIFNLMTAP